MSIDDKIAKRLLTKIMSGIDYKININIMNEYGEIIASGDEERIGKTHLGALEVIKKGESMPYFDYVENDKESGKPGVNIPLVINGEVVGAVGVTGNPKKVNIMANMVKMIAEILIEREMDIDKKILKQTSLNNYIYKIISKENLNYLTSINMWAEKNDYLFNTERIVCIMRLEKNETRDKYKIAEYIIAKMKYDRYYNKQDIISYMGNGQFIIIKSFNDKEKSLDKKGVIKKFFHGLKKETDASELNLKFSVFCGSAANRLENIPDSYEQANFLLNYSECKNNSIYFIDDYILEFVLAGGEGNFNSKMILKRALNIVNKNYSFKETIRAMSKNDMNINKTSKNLSMHRNTILYRMNKIKEALGLDPINNHKDRIKFYILSIILK